MRPAFAPLARTFRAAVTPRPLRGCGFPDAKPQLGEAGTGCFGTEPTFFARPKSKGGNQAGRAAQRTSSPGRRIAGRTGQRRQLRLRRARRRAQSAAGAGAMEGAAAPLRASFSVQAGALLRKNLRYQRKNWCVQRGRQRGRQRGAGEHVLQPQICAV
jgi:hypothetical protein